MAATQENSSLNCELRIIEAANTKSISTGTLFVRYFFCAGNNETIRLNSREIPATSRPYWDEFSSLECSATKDCIEELKKQTVVLELRWRDKTPFLSKFRSSKLVGIAEIRWKDVLESSELTINTWVKMVSTGNDSHVLLQGLNPPALHVEMKVRGPATMEMVKERRFEYGCEDEEFAVDDLFVLSSSLDGE